MGKQILRILGLPGSLRQRSYNRGLLRAAQEVAPSDVQIEIFDLAQVPLFNEDVEAIGDPEPVSQLKQRIRVADALLIATPEYNYSTSGVLKNAIDWASRPAGRSVLRHKPTAIMGASPGHFGTARAQLVLRNILIGTQSFVLPGPEVMVLDARSRFDAEGNLLDEGTRQRVRGLIEALVDWTHRLQSS